MNENTFTTDESSKEYLKSLRAEVFNLYSIKPSLMNNRLDNYASMNEYSFRPLYMSSFLYPQGGYYKSTSKFWDFMRKYLRYKGKRGQVWVIVDPLLRNLNISCTA